jgi:hypothetical protein
VEAVRKGSTDSARSAEAPLPVRLLGSSVARLCAALMAAVVLAGAFVGVAAATPPRCSHLATAAPRSVVIGGPRLTQLQAVCLLSRYPKVASWLHRYPKGLHGGATYLRGGLWDVRIASGSAGVIAIGAVVDRSGKVLVAWTGPQVGWSMARGTKGAFGGRALNSWPFWLALCAVFFVGLADVRRPVSVRNLDLLALLGFGVSLWYFDHGRVFASASLIYPPLAYLLVRALWIGLRGRSTGSRPLWPVWLLAGLAVFACTFRIAADLTGTSVIDVGYSGVAGAEAIAQGHSPYGHMPSSSAALRPCGPTLLAAPYAFRVQANGRCELGDDHGDTYGPVAYESYLPGYELLGWTTPFNYTKAARFTSILFDLLCLVGLALVGRRFGGNRLAATLAFAWTTFPFTLYALGNNTNDTVQAAFLIWGFWLVSSPVARGALGALAGWAKFAPLIVAPMWATYPDGIVRSPKTARFVAAFAAVTVAVFSILLLEPNVSHAAKTFVDRALRWQVGRTSPFSIWDWRQYHAAGLPDLHLIQKALQVLLVLGALVLPFYPRKKTPLQLAALTAALLLGFQLVQTYWFYTYIPWFFPFIAFALLAPVARSGAPVTEAARASIRKRGVLSLRPGPEPDLSA